MLEPERITHVAIALVDGTIYSLPEPARHTSVLLALQRDGRSAYHSMQGFMTSAGRFLDRAEAWRVACDAGQVPLSLQREKQARYKNMIIPLYSEDIW